MTRRARTSYGCISGVERGHAQLLQQRHIGLGVGVAGGPQFPAIKDGVGTGPKTRGLHGVFHFPAAG